MENLGKIDKCLDMYNHPKLNQENVNHLNISITHYEIETAIKGLPQKKSPGPDGFSTEFYQIFKEALTPIVLTFFHKTGRDGTLPTHSMKPVLHSSKNQTRTYQKKNRTTGQSPYE
jgi:hypothetical protein